MLHLARYLQQTTGLPPLWARLEVLLLLHKAYAFTAINLRQCFQVKVCNVPSAACQLQLCCTLQLHASYSMLSDLHGGATGCCLQLCACLAYPCVSQVGLTMYRRCLCLVFTHTFNVQQTTMLWQTVRRLVVTEVEYSTLQQFKTI